MCGKFRAKRTWERIVDPLDAARIEKEGDDPLARAEDDSVTYRVMNDLPVIVWDIVENKRRVVPMRWGFPHPQDWKRPQPIHARSETIETTRAFADAFIDGQCGIVLMQNFNEAPDIDGPVQQHVITPDETMLAAAVIWRRFEVHAGAPFFSCCLITVAANDLLMRLPADRMPAFIRDADWELWLGQSPSTVDERKACLRTRDGARWIMAPEARREKIRRPKPIVSGPGGFL